MPHKNADLHGNAPDKAAVALLIIDVINDLNFPGSGKLLKHALPMARRILALKNRCAEAGIPAIYVNDNFGKWQSDFNRQMKHCLSEDVRGRPLARILKPAKADYFVLKPKHSGFFASTLETLLKYLEVKTLIITGIAGNICVLFTANDAFMRDFHLVVPSDCVASNTLQLNRNALKLMRDVLKADISPSQKLNFERLKSQ